MKINIQPNTIVVTGGLGFIGSRFIKFVYENTPHNIINVDKHTYAGDHDRIPEAIRLDHDRYRYLKADICGDITKYPEVRDATYVVNFAAESHVDNSIADGKPFMNTNVMGVYNLLEQFKDAPNLRRFVQISTDEVYGDMADLRGIQFANESYPLKPSSYYSASKASADLLVQSAARTFGVPYLITRTCNNYGPGQDPEKFLPKIAKCIREGETVPVYGDGQQVREWMFVDENVEIICGLMMTGGKDQIYNIGTGYTYTNNEVVEMISKALDKEVKFEYVPDRLGHDRRYALDCEKVSKKLLMGTYIPRTLESYINDSYNPNVIEAHIS
jgi:dTDP-glucose 4,6-dehydratase